MSTYSMLRPRIFSAGLMLIVIAASTAAQAVEIAYPTKPVRLIIPFPPGGSADPLGRALGAWLSDRFGVPVIGDNRPGAGTAIAHTLAARATPDGYTLLLAASSGMATNPAFGVKLDYNPVKDFAPVGLVALIPQLFVVHPSVPAKTIRELIDLSKAKPDGISFGTPGVGSVGHLSIALINAMTGANFVHVPYKGAAPAVADLVAGRIQVYVGSPSGTMAQVSAGRIRAIAVGDRERLRILPDVPTVAEALPGFVNTGWYALVGPRGMPVPVINRLNAELGRALANAEFTKLVESLHLVPAVGSTPKELGEWIRSELARWTKVVREAGIGAQGGVLH
jgi:tripartite-type tricarboxylate transporter receptor subunit TctC